MTISKEKYDALLEWIRTHFIRADRYNHQIDSGSLRTLFEQDPEGFYVDSDTFKKAMLDCDYIPYSDKADYWIFKISMDSPVILQYFGIDRGRNRR